MTHAAVYWMKAKTWSIVLKSSVVAGHARAGEIAFVKPVNGTDVAEVRVLKVGNLNDLKSLKVTPEGFVKGSQAAIQAAEQRKAAAEVKSAAETNAASSKKEPEAQKPTRKRTRATGATPKSTAANSKVPVKKVQRTEVNKALREELKTVALSTAKPTRGKSKSSAQLAIPQSSSTLSPVWIDSQTTRTVASPENFQNHFQPSVIARTTPQTSNYSAPVFNDSRATHTVTSPQGFQNNFHLTASAGATQQRNKFCEPVSNDHQATITSDTSLHAADSSSKRLPQTSSSTCSTSPPLGMPYASPQVIKFIVELGKFLSNGSPNMSLKSPSVVSVVSPETDEKVKLLPGYDILINRSKRNAITKRFRKCPTMMARNLLLQFIPQEELKNYTCRGEEGGKGIPDHIMSAIEDYVFNFAEGSKDSKTLTRSINNMLYKIKNPDKFVKGKPADQASPIQKPSVAGITLDGAGSTWKKESLPESQQQQHVTDSTAVSKVLSFENSEYEEMGPELLDEVQMETSEGEKSDAEEAPFFDESQSPPMATEGEGQCGQVNYYHQFSYHQYPDYQGQCFQYQQPNQYPDYSNNSYHNM